MFTNHLNAPTHSAFKLAVLIPLALTFWAAPHRAQAQETANGFATVEQRESALHSLSACKGGVDSSALGRQILGFFNTGGYFLTGNGKSDALFGSPKFYNDATFYGHAKHIGSLELSGGAETLLLSDHFVPFTGGNEFDLLGFSTMLSTPRGLGKPRAYVSAGLFYGRLRSVNQGFDRSQFTPSGSVGVEYPLTSHFSVEASYRITQEIRGVSTDGFSFSLKIH
jgi:hypothetical protein